MAAIITGHTHKEYVWDAPLPGAPGGCTVGTPSCTRPMVQTGEYGNNVGRITLSVDPDTLGVTAYTVGTVDRVGAQDLSFPRVAAVKTIVDDAIAAANEVGRQPVGELSKDITTAYAGGHFNSDRIWTQPNPADPKAGRDDRASESTLGDTVADALVATLNKPEYGNATIGVVNPGGLRDELFYQGVDGSDTNHDGVITYAEANAVLPFVNNLWTVKLTGDQFTTVLEQQWQRDRMGNVPSRPFLQLGLSKNVRVVLDPTRTEGDRVVSVLVDGKPLDPAVEYTIATFSFLGTGGDNFRAFTDGTPKDTGLVDRDAWIEYLTSHSPVAPDFVRRQLYAEGIPATVVADDDVAFDLTKLNLTSLGTPETDSVAVYLRPESGGTAVKVGEYPVTDGNASVSFTAPSGLPGSATVLIVPKRRYTVASEVSGTVATTPVVAGTTSTQVDVTVAPPDATGTVEAFVGDELVGSADVVAGAATLLLDPFGSAGRKHVVLRYGGDATTKPSASAVTVRVYKAMPTVAVKIRPHKIHQGRTHARVTVWVSAPGLTIDGYATVRRGYRVLKVVKIVDGRGKATLPVFAKRGKKILTVKFLGNDAVKKATTMVTIRVR